MPCVVSHVIVMFGFPESEKAEKSEVANSGGPASAVRRLLDNDLLHIVILVFIHLVGVSVGASYPSSRAISTSRSRFSIPSANSSSSFMTSRALLF